MSRSWADGQDSWEDFPIKFNEGPIEDDMLEPNRAPANQSPPAFELPAQKSSFSANQQPNPQNQRHAPNSTGDAAKGSGSTGVNFGGFFKVPNRLVGSGLAAKLGASKAWLYVVLCDVANRKRSTRFRISDQTLEADSGLSRSTIRAARRTLIEVGLIGCQTKAGSSWEYQLNAPELTWKPVSERKRSKRKPRGKSFGAENESVISQQEIPDWLRGTGANYARPYQHQT